MFKKSVEWFKTHHVKREILDILHLPLIDRLMHIKSRRIVVAVLSGVLMMLVGSTIAKHAERIEYTFGIHELVAETFGFFLHGVGAVPIMRYLDPAWTLVMGTAEEVI